MQGVMESPARCSGGPRPLIAGCYQGPMASLRTKKSPNYDALTQHIREIPYGVCPKRCLCKATFSQSNHRDLRRGLFHRGRFQNTRCCLKQHGKQHCCNTDTTCNNIFSEATPSKPPPSQVPKPHSRGFPSGIIR